MCLGRRILRVRGEAESALRAICNVTKSSPDALVEKLLVNNFKRLQDERLCKKDPFLSSATFQLELPFCFPYKCEKFDFHLKTTKMRLYLERVPKRDMSQLPFRTLATVIIQLTHEDENFIKENEKHISRDKLSSKYLSIAYARTTFIIKCAHV